MLKSLCALGSLAVAVAFVAATPATACDIYWSQDDGIYRAHADGSNPQLIVPGDWRDLEILPEDGHIYFLDTTRIRRATLDGQSVETVYSHPAFPGYSFGNKYLTIDSPHERLFYTYSVFDGLSSYGVVASRDFDGANANGVTTGDWVSSVALDPSNNTQYFSVGTVWSAALDGSSPQVWFAPDDGVEALAMDLPAGELYWSEPASGSIVRAGQSGIEDVLTGLSLPWDIAIDPLHRHVYWTDQATDTIQRSSVDRPGIEALVDDSSPQRHVAIDPRAVDLRLTRDEVSWEPLVGTFDYDLLQGDLATLRQSGGDFEAATTGCLADDTSTTTVELEGPQPATGEGFWYLARARFVGNVTGSYGGCVSSEFAPRDAGLELTVLGCR